LVCEKQSLIEINFHARIDARLDYQPLSGSVKKAPYFSVLEVLILLNEDV
jgi:hypothetical protein